MFSIVAKSNASQRTKNRLREHGPVFECMDRKDNPVCLNEPGILLEATDGWIGWLPVREIDEEWVEDAF